MITMKNYGSIDISLLSDEQRKEFLLSIIPQIKKYSSISGGEGTAYFIGNGLIVKEFDKMADRALLDSIFEAYAEESQKFARMGYVVPQIYAWAKTDEKKRLFFEPTFKHRYYILEEQVQGRELFLSALNSIYEQIRCECSRKEYEKALQNPQQNALLYKQIVKDYIDDFIMVNAYIESMSDADMEKFIDSLYQMFVQAEYSIPDIHKKNVFMSDGGLKIIDNFMAVKSQHIYFGKLLPDEFLATMLVLLFKPNISVNEMFKDSKLESNMIGEFQALVGQNRIVCTAAIEKVLRAMRKYLDGKNIENFRILHTAYQRLSKILDFNKAAELVSIMNPNYLGM